MFFVTACEALHQGKRLVLQYDGFTRIVEVHAVGVTRDGLYIMRVWQVGGSSSSGHQSGWKILRLSRVLQVMISKESSDAPRSGYRRNDKILDTICCQI